MAASRVQSICLIAAFLMMVGVVAPSQVICDLRKGDSPQILELLRRKPTQANLRRLESSLESGCTAAQAVRPWMQAARFVLLRDTGDKALLGRDGWFFYRPAVQYLIEPAPSTQEVLNAVLAFRDDLAKRGVKLLVMPAPNKASVYPGMLAARAARVETVNAGTRDVLAELKAAGVEVLDLFELYHQATEKAGTPPCYLAQDSHWSPEGMKLAAEAAARRLLEAGWVQKGSARYEAKSMPVERYGDVLKMIRVPQVERLFEPQRMDCEQVIDAGTGKPYADDPNSPILVLGDSFLRIYERDEPTSGGFVAHLAKELGFGLTSVISDGGASTLVRQQLARKPSLLEGKKVVLWEFVERDIRFGTEGWQVVPIPGGSRPGEKSLSQSATSRIMAGHECTKEIPLRSGGRDRGQTTIGQGKPNVAGDPYERDHRQEHVAS
ncbi:MAG: hypothetical protein GX448_03000 [Planctomycetes bacterium]|nr:hypothetical protein [Planctomycetota bacterium]